MDILTDNIVFDKTDGINIINQVISNQNDYIRMYSRFDCRRSEQIIATLRNFEGPKDNYFIFTSKEETSESNGGGGYAIRYITNYVFKNFWIVMTTLSGHTNSNFNIHNLPNNILFSIKKIMEYHPVKDSFNFITFYDKNTNYFKSNSDIHYEKRELQYKKEMIEQEQEKKMIKKEMFEQEQKGILIKEKQTELDKLILENQTKIDYYKDFEQQIIDVNKEKELIKEEKRKIAIVKEKMAQQKRAFDEEKFKFELEKDRINDIDKFINLVLK